MLLLDKRILEPKIDALFQLLGHKYIHHGSINSFLFSVPQALSMKFVKNDTI